MTQTTELFNSLQKFKEDYPNPNRVAFLMMKFEESKPHTRIVNVLKETFKENGISLVRADDKEYHPDLFKNVETYMHGCGIGVALFDGISNNDFNPNVSLEIGYMMSMQKPILHLKDRKLESLQTDLTGKLYKNFDTYDPEGTIPEKVNKWLVDKNLCFTCFECYVKIDQPMEKLVNDTPFLEAIIEDIGNYSLKNKPIVKNLQTTVNGKQTILIFEGFVEFYEVLKGLNDKKQITLHGDTKILEVSTFKRIDEYKEYDNFGNEGKLTCQICRLDSIQGSEKLKIEALNYLPKMNTTKLNEAVVYVTMDGGLTYFHSNMINFNMMYPTKLLTNGEEFSLIDAIKLIAGFDLLIKPSEDEILISHIKHVKYLINKDIKHMLSFDIAGARNVKFV